MKLNDEKLGLGGAGIGVLSTCARAERGMSVAASAAAATSKACGLRMNVSFKQVWQLARERGQPLPGF
jgi:hypothetical protein